MKFELDETEIDRASAWIDEHDKTCRFADPLKCGAIGGRFTWQFTSTGLGLITSVLCACGEKETLTDFSEW